MHILPFHFLLSFSHSSKPSPNLQPKIPKAETMTSADPLGLLLSPSDATPTSVGPGVTVVRDTPTGKPMETAKGKSHLVPSSYGAKGEHSKDKSALDQKSASPKVATKPIPTTEDNEDDDLFNNLTASKKEPPPKVASKPAKPIAPTDEDDDLFNDLSASKKEPPPKVASKPAKPITPTDEDDDLFNDLSASKKAVSYTHLTLPTIYSV